MSMARGSRTPLFLLLALAGCASATVKDAAVPPPEAADAALGLAVSERLARVAWPEWVPGQVPFVLVGRQQQWLFRSRGALPGYSPQPAKTPLGPAYRAPSLTHSNGTRESFTPLRFFAQTDREDGAVTFTVVVPALAPFPRDVWAAIFAHEYFHAFQLSQPRWQADFSQSTREKRQALVALYQQDVAFRAGVDQERALLKSLLQRLHAGAGLDAVDVDHLVALRHGTGELLDRQPVPLREAARALERVEGSARWVEETMDDHPERFQDLFPDWHPAAETERWDRWLATLGGEFYYATGHGLLRLLETTGADWREHVPGQDLDALLLQRTHPVR